MSFMRTLHQIVGTSTEAGEHYEDEDARAAAIVAHFAPYLLRRLAELAAVFDTPCLHSGQGAILACRSRRDGYRAVEYDAPDLSIAFDVINGEARLRWRAGDEMDDRRITMNTPEIVIDTALLDATSAYANRRVARRVSAARYAARSLSCSPRSSSRSMARRSHRARSHRPSRLPPPRTRRSRY